MRAQAGLPGFAGLTGSVNANEKSGSVTLLGAKSAARGREADKPYLELPARYRFAMVARIKIMANMDISEHRKPQDGKIDFARFGGPPVELRVVTVPTSRGLEDVVLRLLAGAKPLPLENIGLSQPNLQALRGVMQKNLRPGSRMRPHRLRQDDHAAFGSPGYQHHGPQNLDGRGSH